MNKQTIENFFKNAKQNLKKENFEIMEKIFSQNLKISDQLKFLANIEFNENEFFIDWSFFEFGKYDSLVFPELTIPLYFTKKEIFECIKNKENIENYKNYLELKIKI